jgi:hypothetical protein
MSEKNPAGAKAAEKLNFSESAKNGSCQNTLGAIPGGRLMVFYPSISALLPSIWSLSAACKAHVDIAAFVARLKSCPFKTSHNAGLRFPTLATKGNRKDGARGFLR